MGAINLIAFTSLRRQVLGLYGARGVLPVAEQLAALRMAAGRGAYRVAPSLLWIDASDRALVRLCAAGQACSVALMLGFAPRLMTILNWALYLSFVSTGGPFLSFQWDALLLESGLHAALAAPGGFRPGLGGRQPSWPAATLLRWLFFRLHFESGLVKLLSRDPTWRSCSACAYHFETQPLPTPLGWYAHHIPQPGQRLLTGATLALELAVPLLTFAPRRARGLAVGALMALQVLIAVTGNYGFFNALTMILGLWNLDDETLRRLPIGRRAAPAKPAPWWRRIAAVATAAPIALLSAFQLFTRFGRRAGPASLQRLRAETTPFRSINPYGLFAMMTTVRLEIAVEGSADGRDWREYHFRYKPTDVHQPPRWVAPHQPRLDWQMWFAALGRPPVWFVNFLARLLEGSPEVLSLLASNPFPDHPPRFVRALLYQFRMTDLETRRRTGAWWHRELLGIYFPPASAAS
jgi:hypothetical protein